MFFGLAFGWAFLSATRIAGALDHGLAASFGARAVSDWPAIVQAVISTVMLFLAYEFAYWLDHYLSHKLPILWQFHRVHHGAESLSLLTNFRVHPVDTIVFANLVALITGAMSALLAFLFGHDPTPFGIGGTNVLIFVGAICLAHLQHSHLKLRFGPRGDRLLLSPMHHQCHHSLDPRHFDRNFGNTLALWDRLFGTLYVPDPTDGPMRFGLGAGETTPHGLKAALVTPLLGAALCLRALLTRARHERDEHEAGAPNMRGS